MAFLFCGVLLAFLIDKFTYYVLIWLDMSSDIATIGQQWASIAAIAAVFNGINEAFFQFMNTIDTDIFSNVILTLMSAVNTSAIAIAFLNENASLVHVAFIKLGTVVLFIMINIIFMAWKGWLGLCWSGLVESFSLKVGVSIFAFLPLRYLSQAAPSFKEPCRCETCFKNRCSSFAWLHSTGD